MSLVKDFQYLLRAGKSQTSISDFAHLVFTSFWHRALKRAKLLKTRRRLELYRDEVQHIFNLSKKLSPRIFNLDLHIGVIADLAQEFAHHNIYLTQWSISAHNYLVQDRLPISDPVRFVNQSSWRELSPRVIDRFQSRYRSFLNSFDGYVCTYSPTFAELFGVFEKPILVVTATRYEAPYTDRPSDWARFNEFLITSVNQGQILLAANNYGDADYLTFFTGLKPLVVPSLCRKPKFPSTSTASRFIMSSDPNLSTAIETQTEKTYCRPGPSGRPYEWESLARSAEVLVFPQNISTMTLFELATAGVPVAVPSRMWLKQLRAEGFNILNECTFHELANLSTDHLDEDNPTNYRSPKYVDWWLDRADFYNHTLMPNVRIVDSVDELLAASLLGSESEIKEIREAAINTRNSRLQLQRQALVQKFLDCF